MRSRNTHTHSEDCLDKDTDKVVETKQRTHDLLVVLHDDVNPRPDALVDQFCKQGRLSGSRPRSHYPLSFSSKMDADMLNF